jgi:MFS family permease
MCVFYGLNYVDKVTMGWAVLFTFKEDLGLVGNQYSWTSPFFDFGYLAAQYPANFLLQRFSTSQILAFGTLTWGAIIVLPMACSDYAGRVVLRFFLGVAESMASPGFVLYTSHTTRDKSRL